MILPALTSHRCVERCYAGERGNGVVPSESRVRDSHVRQRTGGHGREEEIVRKGGREEAGEARRVLGSSVAVPSRATRNNGLPVTRTDIYLFTPTGG